MRILWLAPTSGLLRNHAANSSYHGGGWVASLQKAIEENRQCLALAYSLHGKREKKMQDGTVYYPIHIPSPGPLQKLRYYYGGYKKPQETAVVRQLLAVIEDFQPSIIHLFGMESPLSCIIGKTDVPVVVHLQGLLAPYSNAFFPPGMNKFSFLLPFSAREWIFRNGSIYAGNSMKIRGEQEVQRFKKTRYTMGRTCWDKHLSTFLAPQATYFHVDEVLRDSFYEHAGEWVPREGKLTICSTISETVYKGLDVILKTARLLRQSTDIDFEWKVIGVSAGSSIVAHFERCLGIDSQSVNIRYEGKKSEQELVSLLKSSTIYVHPSYIDNSPNSLCEAQILGLPVIATFVGGIPSLIEDGKTGLLVPANAPYELASLIKQLYESEDLQCSMGRQAAEVALHRHDPQTIYRSLVHTYEHIIKEYQYGTHI